MKDLTKIKFKENGDFNHFPGNTVVSNLYENEKLMEVVELIQTEFRDLPFINKFTLTPPDSIHMTVMELLCHDNREKDFWSKDLALDIPLEEANRYFYEQLTDFPLVDEKIVMRPVEMGRIKSSWNLPIPSLVRD
ncbi:hypothetical protein SORDD24_00976 [Streptococcus oralis]|uniref:DUF1868 domain-containing protein n=1 Tax=Streptococcus oralis TaxID=1303 RepID=A0A139QR34_STROR|nr:hypothetical protein SORDD24_00976 [Streptococcus oralis]